MKRTLYAMSVMALMVVLSFLSCSKDADGYSGDVELGSNKLTIRTKAVSGGTTAMTVATPINIYVFDSQDKCIAQKTLEAETDKADMKLQAGKYKVYAVAGASSADYSLPKKDDATPQSIIALNGGKQHSDLMTATSDVTLVEGEDSDLTLLMQRKVLMLTTVNIADVPDDVTGISATLSPLYENISLSGDYSGEHASQTINLSKQNDGTTWTADCNLFLLPSVGNPSVKFVFTTADGKKKTFTYASQKPLVANYKVSINVNYLKVKEPTLKCNINGVDWAGTDVWSFDADERNFTVDGGGDEPGGGTVVDGTVPHVGTLYKGCYVLKTEQIGNNTVVTLIAPEQYNTWKYTKGNQSEMKTEIDAKLNSVSVDGVSGWRLPSKEELQYVKDNYETVDALMSALGIQRFFLGSPSSNSFLFKDISGSIFSYILKSGNVNETPGNGVSVFLRPFTTLLFTD